MQNFAPKRFLLFSCMPSCCSTFFLWCTFIQPLVSPALGGGIELSKTINKANYPAYCEWIAWLYIVTPACLGCFRMHSRMRSGGQQDGDLTLSFNTRLRLLSPFHTAFSQFDAGLFGDMKSLYRHFVLGQMNLQATWEICGLQSERNVL